jgi:hypothetical protein
MALIRRNVLVVVDYPAPSPTSGWFTAHIFWLKPPEELIMIRDHRLTDLCCRYPGMNDCCSTFLLRTPVSMHDPRSFGTWRRWSFLFPRLLHDHGIQQTHKDRVGPGSNRSVFTSCAQGLYEGIYYIGGGTVSYNVDK